MYRDFLSIILICYVISQFYVISGDNESDEKHSYRLWYQMILFILTIIIVFLTYNKLAAIVVSIILIIQIIINKINDCVKNKINISKARNFIAVQLVHVITIILYAGFISILSFNITYSNMFYFLITNFSIDYSLLLNYIIFIVCITKYNACYYILYDYI